MRAGSYEHISSSIAALQGLQWNGRKLSLASLGAADRLEHLFFVSDKSSAAGDYLYLVDQVSLAGDLRGIPLKPKAFLFTKAMVDHLARMKHRCTYLSVGNELVGVKESGFNRLNKHLGILVIEDDSIAFEQHLLYELGEIRQPYLPQRHKKKKPTWQSPDP